MYGKYQQRHQRAKAGYKGKLEPKVAKMLYSRKNVIVSYESQKIPYVLPKSYRPDFTIQMKDGRVWYLEVKGWFRYEDQVKMKAVKFSNPDVDIRMYFPSDGKVQNSSMTNSQWCEKYGFKYAVGKMPRSWFQ